VPQWTWGDKPYQNLWDSGTSRITSHLRLPTNPDAHILLQSVNSEPDVFPSTTHHSPIIGPHQGHGVHQHLIRPPSFFSLVILSAIGPRQLGNSNPSPKGPPILPHASSPRFALRLPSMQNPSWSPERLRAVNGSLPPGADSSSIARNGPH